MSTSPVYYFRDTKTGADVNAVAGSDANDGLSDANAFQTYDHLLTLYNSAAAGTRFRLARGCGFTQAAQLAVNNQNAAAIITSITRSGSTATATTAKAHNMEVSDTTPIRGADQPEYNITATVLSVTSTTFTFTVSGTPATATAANAIYFEGGMVVIEEYTSTEFTPAVDAAPYVAYNLDSYQLTFSSASASEGYRFSDIHYDMTGTVGGSSGNCPWYFSSTVKQGNIFEDLTITRYRHGLRPSAQTGAIVRNNTITDCPYIGIYGSGNYCLIDNNLIYNNGHKGTGGSALEHNVYVSYGNYNTYRGNTLYQSAMSGGSASGSALGVSFVVHGVVTGLTLEDNLIYEDIGAAGNGAWGIGIDTGYPQAESFTDITVRRNKILNVGNQAIHCSSWVGGVIENNLIIQNNGIGQVGIKCEAANQGAGNAVNSNIKIRNNSMYGAIVTAIEASTGTGFEIVSNAAESTVSSTFNMLNTGLLSITDTTNFTAIDYNLAYAPSATTFNYENGVTGTLPDWQAASAFSDNDQVADPLFTSSTNLIPLTGSPLFSAGHPTLSATEDYLEVARDGTPDAGAYEGSEASVSLTVAGVWEPGVWAETVWAPGVWSEEVYAPPAFSSATSGTAVSCTEADIVNGGKTIILTLTGDTFIAAGTGPIGSTADTQALIDGITSAQTESLGWNNEVRDKEVTTAVVRTADNIVTITLTASALFDITATETITPTIPAAILTTSTSPIVSSPTFNVNYTWVGTGVKPGMMGGLGRIGFR